MAALTATAAPPVRQEIVGRLGLLDPRQVIRDFDRPEIHLSVRSFHRATDKEQAVLDIVRAQAGSGLVYAATSRKAQGYAGQLGVPVLPPRFLLRYFGEAVSEACQHSATATLACPGR